MGVSCVPDVSIKDELSKYCAENPTVTLCSPSGLEEELETFCKNNSHLLLCADPAKALATFLQFCRENPSLPLCSEPVSEISKFCKENSQMEICQKNGIEFMVNSSASSVAQKTLEKGNFLTLGGVSVPYVKQNVVYYGGMTLSEIVFPEGIPSGTLIDSDGLTRFLPGVVPSSGSVRMAYLEWSMFETLLGKEAVKQELCAGLDLYARRFDAERVEFQVLNEAGEKIIEMVLSIGQYEVLTSEKLSPQNASSDNSSNSSSDGSLNCPDNNSGSYLISNSGSSFFLGKIQQFDHLPLVTPEHCWSRLLNNNNNNNNNRSRETGGSEKSYDDFLIPSQAAPDGLVRSIFVQPQDYQSTCWYVFRK